jgi:hypothetical protein
VSGDPANGPNDDTDQCPARRVSTFEGVRIFGNYIHHDQHPSEGSNYPWYDFWDKHAEGYGVVVDDGGVAEVYENLFDGNRHAIAASGSAGGYAARRNLVLKGGGIHGRAFHEFTHLFDAHGTGDNGMGGAAGVIFVMEQNAFQYRNGAAVHIRGRPCGSVEIRNNLFPHDGLENDWGDDAIRIRDRDDLDVIHLGPNNTVGYDSYGQTLVCDFDGDAIDDLFLPTGRSFWFSSKGEFPWSYLSGHSERMDQVQVGYFDDDERCDVVTERDGQWFVSSGGVGEWTRLGAFGAPLSQVRFGRFDPNIRDHRVGYTRRTTHAFWRRDDGQWRITPLTDPPQWNDGAHSSFPLAKLGFGDFNGDGVTDVLAVNAGRWAISRGGTTAWENLNPYLGDSVESLLVADLNHNNIDDLIRIETDAVKPTDDDPSGSDLITFWVSDDGRGRWRILWEYSDAHLQNAPPEVPVFEHVGRFGDPRGGGVLYVDRMRVGHFFSAVPTARGWHSVAAY